jgi:polyferredoxin
LRPRLLAYGGLLAASATALLLALILRTPFEANLLRFQGAPWVVDNGSVRNQFELHLVNKNPGEATFTIGVKGRDGMRVIVPQREIKLGSLESSRIPIFVSVDQDAGGAPFAVEVEVKDGASGKQKLLEAPFLGPRKRG